MIHFSKAFLILALGLLLTVTPVFGQAEAGSVAGTVKDSSGALVVGASVKTKNVATATERATKTDNTGHYNIPGLEPGSYSIQVSHAGFQTFETTVEVTVGSSITADAQLTVGATTTVVEVVAESGTVVNTQTQEMSQLIDAQQVAMLPSLTRNPYDFVALSGNVSSGDNTTTDGASSQNLTSRGVGYSLNGQRESGTEILLDGVENVGVFSAGVGENVPVDSVQEYSIITNNFSAEYGRASGGVVNVTSKPGTNQFHGSGWEFNRLSAYTANTWENDAANAAAGSIVDPKGIYTRNQFGFQGGGPVIKNKLFVFESTEWTRIRSSATETEEVLDPSFVSMLPSNVQNYFSTYGATQAPASGTVVTAGQLATAGLTVGPINGITAVSASQPIFDVVNFKAPFDAGGGLPENAYSLLGRVDYNLTDRTQMFFRAGRESLDQFDGSAFYSAFPQYNVGTTGLNQSYLYSLSHTFTNNTFSSTKLSFTRYNSQNTFNQALTATPNLMFVSPSDPATGALIQMPGLENYGEPGEGGLPFGGPQNTLQVEQDVAWTKGKHSMRFGGQLTYIQLNVGYGAYAQSVEQLGPTQQASMDDLTNVGGQMENGVYATPLVDFAARVNPNGVLPCNVDIYGNLIQTTACTVAPPLTAPSYDRSYRYHDWALYAQDSFRVTPRLTLNYGLRYEHYGVQHDNHSGLDSNFYFGSGSSIEEQTRNGQVDIADKSPVGQFWAPRWGTAAPRVGFAYDLFGDGKSSIRGGYGISYERNFGNVTFNASFNPPASAVINVTCAPSLPGVASSCPSGAVLTNSDLGALGQPGAPAGLPPVELRMPAPHINVAQTQFWSLALQRELTRNTVLELSYSGAHGAHLYDIENINLPGAGQVNLGDALVTGPACSNTGYVNEATGVAECLTRPNSQYSNINMRGSLGASNYDAMNVKLQTQNIHNTGLSLVANYTYSHSLDDLSSTFGDSLQGGSGDIGSLGYTNFLDPKLDYGSSDFDIRNRFVVSPIWQTPWFNTGKGFARQALGGWTVSGIITARTGVPFSVFDYNNDENFYTVPRLSPATPITDFRTGTPVASPALGAGVFTSLTVPIPASFAPLNSELGISDFGPYPANMTSRNAFRGPGAWNTDLALSKSFKLTERVGLDFRLEGFDAFNHHNFYVVTPDLAYFGPATSGLPVEELKGGLGTLATGGNHDERRFGQLSARLSF